MIEEKQTINHGLTHVTPLFYEQGLLYEQQRVVQGLRFLDDLKGDVYARVTRGVIHARHNSKQRIFPQELQCKAVSHWNSYPFRKRPQAFQWACRCLHMKEIGTRFYPCRQAVNSTYGKDKNLDQFEILTDACRTDTNPCETAFIHECSQLPSKTSQQHLICFQHVLASNSGGSQGGSCRCWRTTEISSEVFR